MKPAGRLPPDFKTLPHLRAENTVAIKNVCRESEQAREALGLQEFTAPAGRGYYSGEGSAADDFSGVTSL